MKRKIMTSDELFGFLQKMLKLMEDKFYFLRDLVVALETGREEKVEHELKLLEGRIDKKAWQEIGGLKKEIDDLEIKLLVKEEEKDGVLKKVESLKKEVEELKELLEKEGRTQKPEDSFKKILPNPFQYFFLWLQKKKNNLTVFLSLPKRAG